MNSDNVQRHDQQGDTTQEGFSLSVADKVVDFAAAGALTRLFCSNLVQKYTLW